MFAFFVSINEKSGWFKKKVPDAGVTHRGSTDNKLGGGLITKYRFKSVVKIITFYLNANSFLKQVLKNFSYVIYLMTLTDKLLFFQS